MVKLENIVGTVQGLRGRIKDIIFDLFFAEKRVVAAVVLYFSDLTDIYGKISLITFLFGNQSEHSEIKLRSARLMNERRLAFKDKTLDEISALHNASMKIDYENIVSVTIKKGLVQTSLRFVLKGPPEKKIDFWLEESQVAEVEDLIKKVLPNKIK
jgi:hypothetical protein